MTKFASHLLLGAILLASWPFNAQAADIVDLSISASSVRFSESVLYSGETVRIYATIRNQGQIDSTAQVFFYTGEKLIGESQPVSVLADGGADDVFIDFRLPEGSFNIRAVIQGADPADSNSANDVALTPLFKTISDSDRDGVLDGVDNCRDISNADQADADGDNAGDACDYDLDGDGVGNLDDDFPNDPSKSKRVVDVAPVKTPEPEPAPVAPAVTTVAVQPTVAVVASEPAFEPTPSVQGVQVEETAVSEPTEVALDLSALGSSQPTNSPAARFSYRQVDWRTYDFVALPPLGGGQYTYAWDFGDGSTSAQTAISHQFPASGVYMVTLATIAADGTVTSDAQELKVSFFHLANPLVLVTIGILIATLLGLLVLIFRLRRGDEL